MSIVFCENELLSAAKQFCAEVINLTISRGLHQQLFKIYVAASDDPIFSGNHFFIISCSDKEFPNFFSP